tara:strand:- start:965 stop:1213 length:249 start_codon:yes stop_codon:yes gene_type:complete
MFPSHETTQDIETIRADYQSLIETAERDRRALLAVLDTIGVRLDELTCYPEVAEKRVRSGLSDWGDDLVHEATTPKVSPTTL